MQKREIARRVFAKEFSDSNLIFKENEEQYSPQYLLTPTGAKCNRLFIIGTLLEKENTGNEGAEFWRARIADPTGIFLIQAGQYQPEAMQSLARLNPPCFVAVVGKPALFKTESGEIITSIRPEVIQAVEEYTRNIWVFDTAKQTVERIANSNSEEALKAKQHYSCEPEQYKEMVQIALQSLKK
ncbi:MAG: DNA-binding protein [Methanocellales archaeon]